MDTWLSWLFKIADSRAAQQPHVISQIKKKLCLHHCFHISILMFLRNIIFFFIGATAVVFGADQKPLNTRTAAPRGQSADSKTPAENPSKTRIAILDKQEILEIIKVRVLAKPENATSKKAIQEAEKALHDLQSLSFASKDDESRKEHMKQASDLYKTKQNAEKEVEGQVAAELMKVVKAFISGKFSVVIDQSYISESLIVKDADLVNITLDLKESLLTR